MKRGKKASTWWKSSSPLRYMYSHVSLLHYQSLLLKLQLEGAATKSEQLHAEIAVWQTRCSKLQDSHSELSTQLKKAEVLI